jgi:hypothetical protein
MIDYPAAAKHILTCVGDKESLGMGDLEWKDSLQFIEARLRQLVSIATSQILERFDGVQVNMETREIIESLQAQQATSLEDK